MAEELKLSNPGELEGWLTGKPAAWSQIIAIRIALRVLPMIGRRMKLEIRPRRHDDRAILVTAVFRACCLSWTVHKFPSRNIITASSDAADDATKAAIRATKAAAKAADAAAAAADAAVFAADAAAASFAAAAAAAAFAAARDGGGVLKQIAHDVAWLEAQGKADNSRHAARLAEQPLWHENTPQSVQADWQTFKSNPFAADNGYQPWIRWYEAVAPFDPQTAPRDLFSDDLTKRIATQPNEWWKRPALDINTDIARWLAEEETAPKPLAEDLPTQLTEALDQLPDQQPAPYLFDWRGGRMEVLPPDALPNGGISAQRYLDETRDKADSLLDTLARSNCDPGIARKVERLRSVLTDQAADLIPEIVNSRTIAVERLAKWLDNPLDREELSSLLLSDVDDLAETARLLCDNLPELSKENVRKLADALTENSAVDFLTNLNALRDGIKDAKFIGPGAQAAFDTLHEECAEPADDDLQRHKIALYGVTVRNFLNALLRVQKWTSSATAKTADATRSFAKELIKFTQEVHGNIRPETAKLAAKWIVVTTVSTTAVAALYVTNYGTIREIVRYFSELKRVTDSLDMIRSGTVPPPSAPPPVPPAAPPRTARPTSEKGPTRPA